MARAPFLYASPLLRLSTCQELGRRETLDREGCACSADPSPHGFMGAGLLLLMGGLARRRRRR